MILNEDVCGKYKDFEPFKMECNVFHVGCQACWFSLWTDFPPFAQFILFQTNIFVQSACYTTIVSFATVKHKLTYVNIKKSCQYDLCMMFFCFFTPLLPRFRIGLCSGGMVPCFLIEFANLVGTVDTWLNIRRTINLSAACLHCLDR